MTVDTDPDLLELTLAAANKDEETVRKGAPLVKLLDGMSFHESTSLVDSRGSLAEILDPRWNWHPDPIVYCYFSMIRPGIVKGWALHKLHEDRYFVIDGEIEVVLFDPRPNSSTYGKICRVVLSEERPRIMNVPTFVWHADHNIGLTNAKIVNLPTGQYDHANPDKYRLPLDTPLIPFDFGGLKGW